MLNIVKSNYVSAIEYLLEACTLFNPALIFDYGFQIETLLLSTPNVTKVGRITADMAISSSAGVRNARLEGSGGD